MPFQSRNRESFIFYLEKVKSTLNTFEFQSRNRESFIFYLKWLIYKTGNTSSFNLVIENLLFSTALKAFLVLLVDLPFQSRNRESFIFYLHLRDCFLILLMRFNLVIENLLFSTYLSCTHPLPWPLGFNLVIENLLFSTRSWSIDYQIVYGVSIS